MKSKKENEIDIDEPLKIDEEDLSVSSDLVFENTDNEGRELPIKDITKKIRVNLKLCRKEKEEYLTGWQRSKADYINLQKELESLRFDVSINTKEKVVEKLLPGLDSFDMAFKNKDAWEKIDKDWRIGIEHIYNQLINGLLDSNIEKISEINVLFNPNLHQSISIIKTNKKELDNKIESIIQVGYKIGEKVIRPAIVNIYQYQN